MAGINKQSLREEFDTVKAQFEHPCTDGKIVVAGRALCPSMLMLFEVLRAVFMERRTKPASTPANPPPSTPKDDTAVTRTGAKGKGKSQHNAHSGNTRTIETTQVVDADPCDTCGEDLNGTSCQGHETRTRIDSVFKKMMIHLDTKVQQCPRCQVQTKRRFLADRQGAC